MKKILVLFMLVVVAASLFYAQELTWCAYGNEYLADLEYQLWDAGMILPFSISFYDVIDVQHALQALGSNGNELVVAKGFSWNIQALFIPSLYSASSFDGFLNNNGSWSSRQPLISIPITFAYDTWVTAKTVFDVREDHNTLEFPGAPQNMSNIPNGTEYIDFTAPFEAWIGVTVAPFSIFAGRAKTRMGNGVTGSLILSDSADFYDQVRIQFKTPDISYSVLLINIYPLVFDMAFADTITTWEKNVVYHRFEFLLWKRVSIALTEAIMIGGMNLPLAVLNPLMVFHDLFLWNSKPQLDQGFMPASSFLGAEIRVNPWKYMELYASFAMNQIQTDFEKSYYGATTIPDAFGVLCGAKVSIPSALGWIHGAIEFVYTNPWLYIRENELNSYFWHRQLTSNYSGALQYVTMPLGYPEGPDSIVWYASIGLNKPKVYGFDINVSFITKGEQDATTQYVESVEAAALRTPSGIPQYQYSVGFDIYWDSTSWLSVFAGAYYVYYNNYMHQQNQDHQQLNITLGVKFGFEYDSKYKTE